MSECSDSYIACSAKAIIGLCVDEG